MAVEAPRAGSLRGEAELKRQLQGFCRTDNWLNFVYIARAWAVIALAVAGAITFSNVVADAGLHPAWILPAYVLAVFAVGASQHQLAGATHEATHHTLFRNRLLNELASDWLCMFPLFGSTYTFRLYHLQHHQFINDPERDPDFAMLERSGHWLGFPVTRSKLARTLARQILLVDLLRYALVRFRYNALSGGEGSAYRVDRQGTKVPLRISLLYLAALGGALLLLYRLASPAWLLAVPPLMWAAVAACLAWLPDRHFELPRIRPVYPRRYLACSRLAFMTILFTGLSYGQMVTGRSVWWWYVAYWLVPLLTTFQFFMVLRQLVQHGNRDRSFIGNTRVFLVNPWIRYSVFPFGMDYHAPHHMFATIPHYRLRELHDYLLRYPEYRQGCSVVENYFVPARRTPGRLPTIAESLGPEHAAPDKGDVWVDDSVLDGCGCDADPGPASEAPAGPAPKPR